MKILGLTGSIGMGKSTLASMARRLGIPVFDADQTVHSLMAPCGKAVKAITALFPDAAPQGVIERSLLAQAVFGNPERLRALETILHPLVNQARHDFLKTHKRQRQPLVILDIPLLFEKGGWRLCDRIMVVTAPKFLQTARVLKRSTMTVSRLEEIRKVQMPEVQKCALADFVIMTGLGKRHALHALKSAVTLTLSSQGKARCAKSYWIRKPQA